MNYFPVEAQVVLDETARNHYTSPWRGNTPFQVLEEIDIRNAWRAKDAKNGEMWCAELMVSGRQADSPKVISSIWIVSRPDDQATGQAGALEVILASSTIERCKL